MFLKIPMLLGDISIHTFSLYHTLRYEDYQNIFYHRPRWFVAR